MKNHSISRRFASAILAPLTLLGLPLSAMAQGLPTIEDPSRGTGSGIMQTLQNYGYDIVLLVALLVFASMFVGVCYHAYTRYSEIHTGRATWGQFGLTVAVGAILTDWDHYLRTLTSYLQPRARGSVFSELYLRSMSHHLRAIAKPGGLFEDTAVTRLPWRGQTRRMRMVVYRRTPDAASMRHGQSPEQALTTICDRLGGGLANAGVKAKRMGATSIHDWLLRWFNPDPSMLGKAPEDRERFYALTRYPEELDEGEIELASGTDFAQRLFFGQPRSDVAAGLWLFDGMPHRVIVVDRLRTPPTTGHLTGETRKGGDAMNALFDQLPEDTVMCLTLVATP